MTRSAGFTFIELIVVLVILGVISAIAVPKFFSVTDFSEDFYFNDVLASVRYAQKLAVVSGCDTQVLTSGQMVIFKRRTNCTSGIFDQDIRNPTSGGSTFFIAVPANLTFIATLSDFYFDGLGRAHNTSTSSVSNAAFILNTRTFTVVGETGLTYEP